MKNLKNIFLILFLLPAMLFAQDYAALADSAEAKYNRKLYNDAIADYQKVIDAGMESAALYFNMGNACFKAGDIPSAILYYEKAKKLAPSDEDIQYNLDVARNQTVDKIEAVPEMFLDRWYAQLENQLDANSWAIVAIALLALVCILAGIFFLSRRIALRKMAFWSGLVFLIFFGLSLALTQSKYKDVSTENTAIVFDPSVTIKSSPDEGSVDLFVLHEGAKVELVDQVGQWYKIRIANGSVGWMKKDALKEI